MAINHVPRRSADNPTGCCPKINPSDWDGKTFTFKSKLFVRFTVSSFLYIPINMGSRILNIMEMVDKAGAEDKAEGFMLSYDISPWQSEHFLSVTKEVAGLENVKLSGTFLSKVFEGPYKDAPKWMAAMQEYVHSQGKKAKKQ